VSDGLRLVPLAERHLEAMEALARDPGVLRFTRVPAPPPPGFARDWLDRYLAGREDGFEELVRRYQRPIVAYVYRMVGDYDAALDLAQEVFIKVYNSLGRYRPEFKFSTWIYRIAHNAAIDHLRRVGASRTEEMTVEGEGGTSFEKPLASKALTPEQETERGERRAEIEEVVGQLPHARLHPQHVVVVPHVARR